MEIRRIQEAFKLYENSELIRKLETYRDLSDGKSAKVFFSDVKRRVNMEYMGLVNEAGFCPGYSVEHGKIGTIKNSYNLKDLIVPNSLIVGTTRLYAEFATSKPLLSNKEDFERLKQIDFDDLLGRLMVVQSWAGKQLLKGVITEEGITLINVTPKDYFAVPNMYNPKVTDAFVIFSVNKDKKMMLCEIYEENSVELRAYALGEDFKEIQYPLDCEFEEDGLGFKQELKGWGVVEVQNMFGKSDYNDDMVGIVREIVVGDTISSQAFQKVANPLLQVPESVLEYDEDGKSKIHLDDRVVIVGKDDKDIKQVEINMKTADWEIQRKMLVTDFYRLTGVNDVAFGVDVTGNFAGEGAKQKQLERPLATVSSKRKKCIEAIKKVVNWALLETGDSGGFEIEAQEILTTTTSERISIACQAVANGIMSVENAIDYISIAQDTEEEKEKIKKDIASQEKIVNMLNVLGGIYHEEGMKEKIDTITKEMMEELGV